jgi:hypothetical protein
MTLIRLRLGLVFLIALACSSTPSKQNPVPNPVPNKDSSTECTDYADDNGQVISLCDGPTVVSTNCQALVGVSYTICPSSIYCSDTKTCVQ